MLSSQLNLKLTAYQMQYFFYQISSLHRYQIKVLTLLTVTVTLALNIRFYVPTISMKLYILCIKGFHSIQGFI